MKITYFLGTEVKRLLFENLPISDFLNALSETVNFDAFVSVMVELGGFSEDRLARVEKESDEGFKNVLNYVHDLKLVMELFNGSVEESIDAVNARAGSLELKFLSGHQLKNIILNFFQAKLENDTSAVSTLIFAQLQSPVSVQELIDKREVLEKILILLGSTFTQPKIANIDRAYYFALDYPRHIPKFITWVNHRIECVLSILNRDFSPAELVTFAEKSLDECKNLLESLSEDTTLTNIEGAWHSVTLHHTTIMLLQAILLKKEHVTPEQHDTVQRCAQTAEKIDGELYFNKRVIGWFKNLQYSFTTEPKRRPWQISASTGGFVYSLIPRVWFDYGGEWQKVVEDFESKKDDLAQYSPSEKKEIEKSIEEVNRNLPIILLNHNVNCIERRFAKIDRLLNDAIHSPAEVKPAELQSIGALLEDCERMMSIIKENDSPSNLNPDRYRMPAYKTACGHLALRLADDKIAIRLAKLTTRFNELNQPIPAVVEPVDVIPDVLPPAVELVDVIPDVLPPAVELVDAIPDVLPAVVELVDAIPDILPAVVEPVDAIPGVLPAAVEPVVDASTASEPLPPASPNELIIKPSLPSSLPAYKKEVADVTLLEQLRKYIALLKDESLIKQPLNALYHQIVAYKKTKEVPTHELVDILISTHALLKRTMTVEQYQRKALSVSGAPTLWKQVLGGLMLAIAVGLAALLAATGFGAVALGTAAIATVASLGSASLAAGSGFLIWGRQQGLSKAMSRVADAEEQQKAPLLTA